MRLYIQGEHGKLLTFTPEEIKDLHPVHLVTKVLTSSSVT